MLRRVIAAVPPRPLLRRPLVYNSSFSPFSFRTSPQQQQQQREMSDMKPVFTTKACPPVGPYSQAMIAGPTIFVSGQMPADVQGNLVEGSIAQKTEACCRNIAAILEEAGSDLTRVVKVNIFLDDMAHFTEMNGVYEKFFTGKPARSCIAAKQLPKGIPIEIECIALATEGSRL
ncbi:Endoribonuclease L-PSP/chorismate mutase-like protein [Lineolata rhizophorae]|uniref:Endoribonuclease L-PSP/chorismate mutase-like protein n=1 Tax=Lineolata rhizophorae TaxID=578093 RepID=A0A6A6NSG5_9PEZI|nr:Endoribonuclease L-PSP/chorismate mutase-like protein [Lineolata rhizophorae]